MFSKHKVATILVVFAVAALTFFLAPDPARADRPYAPTPISYDLSDYGVAPMADVIAHINENVGGTILKIKLDTKKNPGDWKYKTKVLLPDGMIVKIEHDARTLDVLKYKHKH